MRINVRYNFCIIMKIVRGDVVMNGYIIFDNRVCFYEVVDGVSPFEATIYNTEGLSVTNLEEQFKLAKLSYDSRIEFKQEQIEYGNLKSINIPIEDLGNLFMQEEMKKVLQSRCKITIFGNAEKFEEHFDSLLNVIRGQRNCSNLTLSVVRINDLSNPSIKEKLKEILSLGCKISIWSLGEDVAESLILLSDFIGEDTNVLKNIKVPFLIENGELNSRCNLYVLGEFEKNSVILKNNKFIEYSKTIFINDDSKINVEFISKLLQTQKLFSNINFIISSRNSPIEIAIFNGKVIIEPTSKKRGSKIKLPSNIKEIVQMLIDDKENSYDFFVGEELIDEIREMAPQKLYLSSKDILFKVAQMCKAGGETKLEQVAIAYEWLIRNFMYDEKAAKKVVRYNKVCNLLEKKEKTIKFFDKLGRLNIIRNNVRLCKYINRKIREYTESVNEGYEIFERAKNRLMPVAKTLEGIQDSELICSGFARVLCELLENMRNRV